MTELTSCVGAWVDAHIGGLAEHPAIAIHLDRLSGVDAVGDPVETALAAFAALVSRVAELGDPGRAGLVLPLRPGSACPAAPAPTTAAALAEQLFGGEPPSLRVVAWTTSGADAEAYRAPLPFTFRSLDGAMPVDCALDAYYRENRWPSPLAGGAQIERAVHVDAYPPRARAR